MHVIAIALLGVIAGGIGIPMVHLIMASMHTDSAAGASLTHYIAFFSDPFLVGSLQMTLAFCAATAGIATLLAIPAAWWIAQARPGARFLRVLCQVNFAFSGVVYGMLIVTLLGNAGVVSLIEARLFGSDHSRGYVYTTAGLAIGYLGFQTPRAALLLAQAVERLDPQMFSAARVLGASSFQIAWLVTLPQLIRPLLTTFLAVAMMSMASFGTALLIARTIDIFPLLIFREFTGFGEVNRSAAMGVILAACCLTLELAARWLAGNPRPRAARQEIRTRSPAWTSN